jgi:hypothetical protein
LSKISKLSLSPKSLIENHEQHNPALTVNASKCNIVKYYDAIEHNFPRPLTLTVIVVTWSHTYIKNNYIYICNIENIHWNSNRVLADAYSFSLWIRANTSTPGNYWVLFITFLHIGHSIYMCVPCIHRTCIIYIYILHYSISITAYTYFSLSDYRLVACLYLSRGPMRRRENETYGKEDRNDAKRIVFLCDYSNLYIRYHVCFREVVYRGVVMS